MLDTISCHSLKPVDGFGELLCSSSIPLILLIIGRYLLPPNYFPLLQEKPNDEIL